tara:strand:+ start:2308 stop:2535 length:228 start_codon:yes stop_codon:yes gene_type:complete
LIDTILQFLSRIITPLIDGAKWVTTIIFARKSAKAQQSQKQLEKTNETQKKQLEISARPPSRWAAILERMRRKER